MKMYKVYLYKSPSNKIYIGQTCRTLQQRAGNNGIHYKHSTYFYAAIQKYGLNNFQSIILKDNLTLEEANYWEEYYIQYYNSTDRTKGYNISPGGMNNSMSPEGREKISKRMKNNNPMKNPESVEKMKKSKKGKELSEDTKKRMSESHKKKVVCVETGIIYDSRNEAAKAVKVSGSGIGRAIKGEQKTSGGYHWRYL